MSTSVSTHTFVARELQAQTMAVDGPDDVLAGVKVDARLAAGAQAVTTSFSDHRIACIRLHLSFYVCFCFCAVLV